MRVVTLVALTFFAAIRPAMADPTAVLQGGGGGGLLRQGAPADFYVQPTGQIGLFLVLYDDTVPMTGVNLRIYVAGGIMTDGGHSGSHGSLTTSAAGSVNPTQATTGALGEVPITYQAGTAAGRMFLRVEFTYGGVDWQLWTQNGILVSLTENENDLPWIGTGNFILVGSTTTHPSNHYGQDWFLGLVRQLALDYGNRWGLNLAYNDSTLAKGGLFDVYANWVPPHNEHRLGVNQDVRANGGASSIPFDSAVRAWFVQRVIDLFGQAPLLEDAGTSNEHYHIRG